MGGDNDLGGKLIDWAVVEQFFVPSLVKEYSLTDFRRGEQKWLGAFARLKHLAEKAKITLSKDASFDISQEFICVDDSGQPVNLDFTVTRQQVEAIVDPLLSKSLNICRKVLQEQNLNASNIDKLLLVGGPTYMPYLREILSDRTNGLGIPLEFSKDPLTVVSQGAAIFAGGQKLEVSVAADSDIEYSLQLEYKPIGTDTEPLIGGKIISRNKTNFTGFAVRFFNPQSRPPWDSGKVPVNPRGAFLLNIWADKGSQNTYQIEVFDSTGRKCSVHPCAINYTVGLSITDPPLTHDIGVAMANNRLDIFFKKGAPLPAKVKRVHKSVIALRRADRDKTLTIPVVEGSQGTADLNRKIGDLIIHPDKLTRDVPVGSDIEIKLEIDASRLLRAFAYIPITDQDFEVTLQGLVKPQPSLSGLQREFEVQKERLEQAQALAATTNDSGVGATLQELAREDAVRNIQQLLAAGNDPEAARTCEGRLLDLKAALQAIEDRIEVPRLLAEAKRELDWTNAAVEQHGTEEEKRRYVLLKPELERAADANDGESLRRKIDDINQLRLRIEVRTPDFWLGYRDYLLERQSSMADQTQAKLWFAHADRAINSGDLEALKTACNQLWALVPKSEQAQKGYGGGTVKASSA